eukprot:15252227-Ditylum_brightwellii.AAC.1
MIDAKLKPDAEAKKVDYNTMTNAQMINNEEEEEDLVRDSITHFSSFLLQSCTSAVLVTNSILEAVTNPE